MTDSKLGDRSTYVGSSDVAAILGIDPYRSAVELWAEKTRRIEVDTGDSEAIRVGNAMEPALLSWAAERLSRHLVMVGSVPGPGPLLVHPDALAGAIDIEADCWPPAKDHVHGPAGIIEAKTGGVVRGFAGEEWGEDGSDVVPQRYIVQVHTIAACLRQIDTFPEDLSRVAWIPALLGGRGLAMYRVDIDPSICDYIVETVARWWRDFVEADRMPPEGWSSCSAEALLRLRREPGSTVVLGDAPVQVEHEDGGIETTTEADLVGLWQAAGELRRACERREKRYRQALIAATGEAEFAEFGDPDGRVVSLATVTKQPYTVTPKPCRYPRIIKRRR